MKNTIELDRKHNEAIRAEIADRLGHLLAEEPAPSLAPSLMTVLDQIREQETHISRVQAMQQETTDPLAARLLQDIVSEMEAELKEQIDKLVTERRPRLVSTCSEPLT